MSQSRPLANISNASKNSFSNLSAAGTLSDATKSQNILQAPQYIGRKLHTGTSPLLYVSCPPQSRPRLGPAFTPIQLLDPPVNLPSYFCQPLLLQPFLLFKRPQPFADHFRGRPRKVMAIVQFYPSAVSLI